MLRSNTKVQLSVCVSVCPVLPSASCLVDTSSFICYVFTQYSITKSELENRTLWVTVWHNDRFGRNIFLGEVTINFDYYKFEDPFPRWYPLQERVSSLLFLMSVLYASLGFEILVFFQEHSVTFSVKYWRDQLTQLSNGDKRYTYCQGSPQNLVIHSGIKVV